MGKFIHCMIVQCFRFIILPSKYRTVAAHVFARVGAIRYFCNLIQIFRYAT